MTTEALLELGHRPVAAVGALRRKPSPGRTTLDRTSKVAGTEVLIADDKDALEPILRSLRPDLVLSWAFPWRVPAGALDVPTRGSINYHPSLLPRHRGANPFGWTIRVGDSDFGVTWHRMAPEYDSGPVLAQRASQVLADDTLEVVIPRLSALGLSLLPDALERVATGDPGDPQSDDAATDAPAFGADYATIDWSMLAREINTQVRAWAFSPGVQGAIGPVADLGGRKTLVTKTALEEPDATYPHAIRVDCGDGPIWVLETKPLD